MENKEYKYVCEKCNFFTNIKKLYENHLNTKKHETGKRATRSNKKYPEKCELCNYKPTSNRGYILHKLNYHSTKEERKNGFEYYCDTCDFGTFSIEVYETHLKSKKHIKMCE